MDELKTILGTDIPLSTRGIVYLCVYDRNTPNIVVTGELLSPNAGTALNAYANIPNPESQIVTGKTFDDLIKNLLILHKNMQDKTWLKQLGECL